MNSSSLVSFDDARFGNQYAMRLIRQGAPGVSRESSNVRNSAGSIAGLRGTSIAVSGVGNSTVLTSLFTNEPCAYTEMLSVSS